MIDKSLVIPKIKEVIDPEVEINIVDLGLIYSVEVLDDTVNVEMTFTMRGCPLKDYLSNSVKEALFELEGVKEVNVGSIAYCLGKAKKACGFGTDR